MYIKIKHLKYAALSLACVFFASHAYSTYVKADDVQVNSYAATVDSSQTLTTQFAQELKSFVSSKGNQPISTTDLNAFVSDSISNKIGAPITMESLPGIDASKIKIIDQTYPSLNTEDKKKQLKLDAIKYSNDLSYIIISNMPIAITTENDYKIFGNDFISHLSTLSTNNPDYEYFSKLGVRVRTVLDQLDNMEVPETILPMHIKMMRLAEGFLALQNLEVFNNDPISKTILLSKLKNLLALTADFFDTDVNNYFSGLNT